MSQAATNIFTALPVNVLDPVTPGARQSAANLVEGSIQNRRLDLEAAALGQRDREIKSREQMAKLEARSREMLAEMEASLERERLQQQQIQFEESQKLAEQELQQQQARDERSEDQRQKDNRLAEARLQLDTRLAKASQEAEAMRARREILESQGQLELAAEAAEGRQQTDEKMMRLTLGATLLEKALNEDMGSVLAQVSGMRRQIGDMADAEQEAIERGTTLGEEVWRETAVEFSREKGKRGLGSRLISAISPTSGTNIWDQIPDALGRAVFGEQTNPNPFFLDPRQDQLDSGDVFSTMPFQYGERNNLLNEASVPSLYESTISDDAVGGVVPRLIDKMVESGEIGEEAATQIEEMLRVSAALAYNDIVGGEVLDEGEVQSLRETLTTMRQEIGANVGGMAGSVAVGKALDAFKSQAAQLNNEDGQLLARLYGTMSAKAGFDDFAKTESMGRVVDRMLEDMADAVRMGKIDADAIERDVASFVEKQASSGQSLSDEMKDGLTEIVARIRGVGAKQERAREIGEGRLEAETGGTARERALLTRLASQRREEMGELLRGYDRIGQMTGEAFDEFEAQIEELFGGE